MNLRTNDIFKNDISKDKAYTELGEDQLRSLHLVLLEIMDDIIHVCEENGLRYALSGGTLLGAVRHHGFIPWDDDVDIEMPRKDYERFTGLFQAAFGDKYWIHAPGRTENYGMLLARVRKKGTVYRDQGDRDNPESGIFVDIFIVENTYDSRFMRKVHELLSTAALGVTSCRRFFRDRRDMMRMAKGRWNVQMVFGLKIALGALVSWLSLRRCVGITDRIFSMCGNERTEMITIPAGRKKFSGELFRRSDYCRYTKAEFEGRDWNIPAGYDVILRRLYGNYMEPPAQDKREKHMILEFKI